MVALEIAALKMTRPLVRESLLARTLAGILPDSDVSRVTGEPCPPETSFMVSGCRAAAWTGARIRSRTHCLRESLPRNQHTASRPIRNGFLQ